MNIETIQFYLNNDLDVEEDTITFTLIHDGHVVAKLLLIGKCVRQWIVDEEVTEVLRMTPEQAIDYINRAHHEFLKFDSWSDISVTLTKTH